jgi:hypothetical protein
MSYYVIEGEHMDPNNQDTITESTKKRHGPFDDESMANQLATSLIRKNIDNYYHRAWVINE